MGCKISTSKFSKGKEVNGLKYIFISYFGIIQKDNREGVESMSHKKKEQERSWKARKENQKPHGKVKTFAELVDETEKT